MVLSKNHKEEEDPQGGGGLVQATRHLISSYEISNFLLEF